MMKQKMFEKFAFRVFFIHFSLIHFQVNFLSILVKFFFFFTHSFSTTVVHVVQLSQANKTEFKV